MKKKRKELDPETITADLEWRAAMMLDLLLVRLMEMLLAKRCTHDQ